MYIINGKEVSEEIFYKEFEEDIKIYVEDMKFNEDIKKERLKMIRTVIYKSLNFNDEHMFIFKDYKQKEYKVKKNY